MKRSKVFMITDVFLGILGVLFILVLSIFVVIGACAQYLYEVTWKRWFPNK